jgi:hypothetical protein
VSNERMRRVTRDKPCPICGRGDWCLIAEDGSAAICPRVEEGSVKRCGDGGWLHILRDDRPMFQPRCFTTRISVRVDGSKDFDQLASVYERQLTAGRLAELSQALGVSTESLKRLRTGWDGKAFNFPMVDWNGKVIGIRRRFSNGFKCSVRGSRSGLFIPTGLTGGRRLLVCEGTTDVAAAGDLGCEAIGRPSCHGAVGMVARAAKGCAEVVIVGDNDDVGRRGAAELADTLVLHYRVKIVYPPTGVNDLRAWLRQGLTPRELESVIENTATITLTIK